MFGQNRYSNTDHSYALPESKTFFNQHSDFSSYRCSLYSHAIVDVSDRKPDVSDRKPDVSDYIFYLRRRLHLHCRLHSLRYRPALASHAIKDPDHSYQHNDHSYVINENDVMDDLSYVVNNICDVMSGHTCIISDLDQAMGKPDQVIGDTNTIIDGHVIDDQDNDNFDHINNHVNGNPDKEDQSQVNEDKSQVSDCNVIDEVVICDLGHDIDNNVEDDDDQVSENHVICDDIFDGSVNNDHITNVPVIKIHLIDNDDNDSKNHVNNDDHVSNKSHDHNDNVDNYDHINKDHSHDIDDHDNKDENNHVSNVHIIGVDDIDVHVADSLDIDDLCSLTDDNILYVHVIDDHNQAMTTDV